MSAPASPRFGTLLVAVAAFFWASNASASKHLFTTGISPLDLVQVRLTLCALGMGGYIRLTDPEKFRIRKADLPLLLFIGILGMAGAQVFYLVAISRFQVAAAILLQYQAPALIAIWQIGFAGRRLSWRVFLAMAMAIFGCALVLDLFGMDLGGLDTLGVAAGLGSAVSFAIYSIAGEKAMGRYAPATVVFYAMLVAALLLQVLRPPMSGFLALRNPADWFWALYISLPGTTLPFFLYLIGVRHAGPTPACITGTLEPVFAAILCFVFLHEALNLVQITGMWLVIAAVILLQLPEPRRNRS